VFGEFSPVKLVTLTYHKASLVGLFMQDYKSLCAAVTMFATLVDATFDFYILTPVTLKSRSNMK